MTNLPPDAQDGRSPATLSRSLEVVVWGGLLLVVALVAIEFRRGRNSRPGPPLPVISSVASFTLTNQFGQQTTLSDLLGHVWVANIVFSRCPGPCVRMTRRMAEIQTNLPPEASVQLVTLTSDPEYDQPEVLRRFAEKCGARTNGWWFLTGPKAEIHRLALDSLKLALMDKPSTDRESPEDLFVHATVSMVVDRRGRVRGMVEILEPGYMEKVIEKVNQLLAER